MKNVLKNGQKPWSNLTITIKNSRFKIEYNYDNLTGGKDAYYDHHIYWRYKYLHIEPQGKKEKQALESYLINRRPCHDRTEQYDEGIYSKTGI